MNTSWMRKMASHAAAAMTSWLVGLVAITVPPLWADPIDETYGRTFYIAPIGGWSATGGNSVSDYRARMLALTGGAMPKNLRVGISTPSTWFLQATHDSYYDYLYSPWVRGGEMDGYVELARTNDVILGTHVNGMPWGDTATQSDDHLHNFLEKYSGSSLLQVDRLGRIRKASLTQDSTIDEQSDPFSPYLEMQLTLSRNAAVVQDYVARNNRIALRLFEWYREQFPDVVVFASMSSEYAQNVSANSEYCDYSAWSKQEFRDWLSGAGLYSGQGQYPSLAAFNSGFAGATGFPWPTWDAVQPPTTVLWAGGTTADRNWWLKWAEFRIVQVNQMAQAQIRWSREAGWSPDNIFTHQIPFDPNTTDDLERKYASPWTTAFVNEGSTGVTTYGSRAADATLFSALYANDKNWGLFEYNRLSSDFTVNLSALETVWNSKGHVLCPYVWFGQGQFQIRDTAFETALRQFVFNHRNDAYTGLAACEMAPSSRDAIWAMSESDDVEQFSGMTGAAFSNGVLSASITDTNAALSLELAESATRFLISDAYYAVSFRMFLTNTAPGTGQILWQDENNNSHAVSFRPRAGWNIYRFNLAENAAWREKRIKHLELRPTSVAAGTFSLDWLRLQANHCWHFDAPSEIYEINQLTNVLVANGMVSGVSGPDGYFFLATDNRTPGGDADRAFINADLFKKVRVRLTASAGGIGELFWWKRGSSFFRIDFPVQAGTRTYEIDLAGNPDWSGNVTRFRLDPVNTASVTCAVDFISISPVLLSPRLVNSDLIANSDRPVFLWDEAVEPDHYALAYSLELARDFFFTNVVFSTSDLVGTNYIFPGAPALDGLYWWRLRARDALGHSSPWTVPMPMFVRVWNFDRTNDLTVLNQFAPASIVSGTWQATTTGGDPFLHFNNGAGISRGINADVYKRFRCRVRVGQTAAANAAEFFWFPRQGGFASVPVALPGDDQWHEVEIDLSRDARWRGYVDSIRLDPTTEAAVIVSLDWAKLLPAAESAQWDFDRDGDFGGWVLLNQISNGVVASGLLNFDITGGDPYLASPRVSIDGTLHPRVQVRMRNRSSATEAQIYWATVADPVLSETKVVSFPVVANDPGFTTYTVEVGAHPNWSNHIVTTVRLDPVANVSTGRIEIDWISVNDSVNLAPWFSKGLDETINEDAGPRSVGSWATSISPGSTNETTQMLTFIVTNNNPGLFAAQPALSSNGTLSYTPAANSNGSTLVTVELRDDGGTVRGGQDTSPPQTFRITVNAVNDPPSFTKGADLTTAEDSGPHTIVAWASNIRAGPPNETAQTLTFLVTNDNGALFAVEPALGNSGTLTFRPATNAYGLATVTVRLRDNGGTANGGQDTSTSQSLTITVMPVNDPPVAGPDGIFTHWNTVLTLPKATLLTNDFDVDGDTLEIVAASALSTNGGTVVLSNNVVLYRPVSNFVGGDRFTYTVSDGQGSNAIGVVAAQVVQPRLSRAEHLTDGPFQFWFNGIPDSSYTVQASTNLSNWISLGTQATGNTGQFQFLDAASPVLPRRFYRAVCP